MTLAHRMPLARCWAVAAVSLCLFASPALAARRGPDKKAQPAPPAAEEAKKWEVANPANQPTSEVPIDVSEGTWLSLDLSPDGNEVIFDLLGDLYSVPLAGGEAKALTSGMSWDMQPRVSPDGKTIAFISDRAGGDNVWLIDRDGKNPRQVTKETFRLVNSPAWSPDGETIAVHKHFTAERSLGAGEIWLYHRSGGGGLQMTVKANDQKDLGEPAFSPDGRYVYYSKDATPGPVFEYNKDPNGEIYVIERLDRESGEIEQILGGGGGAIRPTPSPDGKSLAYVRRVRGKSVLMVLDLASGRERALYDGLDRDLQETWAIHGVYPAMAWTPDNAGLVFWAQGKLWKIAVASRALSPIPFHVKDTRRVVEALRFPQNVAPERFQTKMLRWVEVNPRGTQVLYQALGHLYVRDLPAGTPRRLTAQNEHFELEGSYSRDGEWIVYTTWDDEALGAVRLIPAAGGAARVLTPTPGHYAEPTFSPDGATVVYRKAGGDALTSPLYGRDPGLYAVAVAGGEPRRITQRGRDPQFGAASDRVFFTTFEGGKRAFTSIELDGSDERTQATSENATEFRLSPDGKWLAFTERFNAYLTPFLATGKALELAPDGGAIPQAKVSRDAGEYLHFSGDSSKLYWSLGPELFTRELKDAFSFLAGAPEKLPEPPAKGLNIGFEAPTDAPAGKIALVGGRVVTMKGNEVIEGGTVLVEGNRIAAVGPRASVAIPPDARVVDVAGKTVLPGLIDAHWHGSQGADEVQPEESWVNLASLAFGVTTLHDPSNDTSEIFASSELAKAGLITAPRIFSTGTILYGAKAPFKAVIESLDDARSHLRRLQAVGAFSVKSYNQPRRDQRQQVVAAARELGMMVVPEGGSLFEHNMTQVVDGHTGVEHTVPVGRIYDDVKQLWGKTQVGYTPTLIVAYGGLWGEEYWYSTTNVWENPRLASFVPRQILDSRSRRRRQVPEGEWNHFNQAKVAAALAGAGVKVNVGAHGQREGLGAHWELWMLVQGGMTPHEALRAGTWNGAHYLGLDKDLGSLEPGKLADVIVIDGNPLENIRLSERVLYTMANGRLYDAATMDQIGNHPKKRGRLWWEDGATAAASIGATAADAED